VSGRLSLSDFPSTHWSFIADFESSAGGARAELTDRFLRRYSEPMHAFLAWRFDWLSSHDIDDLLQDFITDKLIQRSVLDWAQKDRGRLRGFLCSCLTHHSISRLRCTRKFDTMHRLSHDPQALIAAGGADPARQFDRQWARHVVNEAVQRARRECAQKNQPLLWWVFEQRVIRPQVDGGAPTPYADMSARTPLTAKQLENLLITAKRMLRRHVREVVHGYCNRPEEVDQEVRELFAVFGARSSTGASGRPARG
jgi:DNA-directed RNA polymerase specialized sigma24 family protein